MPSIGDEVFQDAPLAPRQLEHRAAHDRIAPVGEDAHLPDRRMVGVLLHAAADGSDPRQDLAHVDGLAHHVVDAGGEELERLLEAGLLVHGDHRRPRLAADHARKRLARFAIAKQEGLDRRKIPLPRRLHPLAELARREACGGHPLPLEPGRVTFGHDIPIIDNDEHCPCPPQFPFGGFPNPRIS
jgi:hypothetical protein